MSAADNRRLIERYYAALKMGDFAAVHEMCAKDIVVNRVGRTPVSGRTEGRERNFGENMRWVRQALVPEHTEIAYEWQIFAVDDECVAGSMFTRGLGKNGLPYDQTHIQIFTIRGGQIVGVHEAFDTVLVESVIFSNELERPEQDPAQRFSL